VECESFEITIFIQKLLVEIYIEEATQDHNAITINNQPSTKWKWQTSTRVSQEKIRKVLSTAAMKTRKELNLWTKTNLHRKQSHHFWKIELELERSNKNHNTFILQAVLENLQSGTLFSEKEDFMVVGCRDVVRQVGL
jgi:hypothetical protein